MSYWIIHSIPGKGIFCTADTRTTADFQDGEGTVYCDGASKLFYFRNTDGSKKGCMCIAGTAIYQTTQLERVAIQKVISWVINSSLFISFLDSDLHPGAKDIYSYVLKYVEKVTANRKFLLESGAQVSLATIIKQQCAIGVGLITGKTTNSIFATGFTWDGTPQEHYSENTGVVIGSNSLYCNIAPSTQPASESQVLSWHKGLIDKFKTEHTDMRSAISDNYDQLYYPVVGNPQGIFTNKVDNICDKANYAKLEEAKDVPLAAFV